MNLLPVRDASKAGSLKICHISSCFPPSRGGVESFVYDLCKGLVERGHHVEVIASDRGKPHGRYCESIDGSARGAPTMGEINASGGSTITERLQNRWRALSCWC